MTISAGYRYILNAAVMGLSLAASVSGLGCGSGLTDRSVARAVISAECEHMAVSADNWAEIAILDWTGGTNAIYPGQYFEGIDLSAFPTADGRTLADDAGHFKESVREEITRIYCDWSEIVILVRNAEDDEFEADSVVHITQGTPPNGGTDIGEAEYDPCNRQHDNAALIFGKRLRQLGGTYTFNEWVTVFANVCAHELGHTLGYGHVARADYPSPPDGSYVELMLDRHTMAEMKKPQRFIVDQTYCSSEQERSRHVGDAVMTWADADDERED